MEIGRSWSCWPETLNVAEWGKKEGREGLRWGEEERTDLSGERLVELPGPRMLQQRGSSVTTPPATSSSNMFPQQYCLRWKYHHSNLQTMFSQLLERQAYCDVTLACEGKTLRAHKVNRDTFSTLPPNSPTWTVAARSNFRRYSLSLSFFLSTFIREEIFSIHIEFFLIPIVFILCSLWL